MSKLTLSSAEIKKIAKRYIRDVDKFPRMFAGLASNLVQYRDGVIYIEISNTQKNILSTYNSAVFYARNYRDCIQELNEAIGFVVIIKDRKTSTGFACRSDVPVEELKQLIDEVNKPYDSSVLSVYSGVFTEEMEDIWQDLIKRREYEDGATLTEIDEFIEKRIYPGKWIKVGFSYIIIKNSSIMEKFQGSLMEFVDKYDGCLNNDLTIMCFMSTDYLADKMDRLGLEVGLIRYEDYATGREHIYYGVGGRTGKEEDCVDVDEVDWLEVIFKNDLGTFARLVK